MQGGLRNLFKGTYWNSSLIILAVSVFFNGFGTGFVTGSGTNFYVNVLNLSGSQVLWMQGIREVPGLILVFLAVLIRRIPLVWRGFGSILLMGLGYAAFSLVQSYAGLLVMALAASTGFHIWLPLQSTIGMSLTSKDYSGRVMGALSSAMALASIAGMGCVAVLAAFVPLRWFFVIAGSLISVGALLLLRLPKSLGATDLPQPRLLFKRRYWLYYVLLLFEGARIQIFAAFGVLILVQHYGYGAQHISLLLFGSGVVNFIAAPIFGRLLDRIGERRVLSVSYVLLALCFAAYATIHHAVVLGIVQVLINLFTLVTMGLTTYVNRIAPPAELAPTLNSGVSVNHITSVSSALVAGTLLTHIGYEALCWGLVAVVLLSVPFALMIRGQRVVAIAETPEPVKLI